MRANVLVKTGTMDRGDWQEARRKGIGGSEVSIIAGINKYKSVMALWREKTGQVPIVESDSEYAYWGTMLESVVRREFTLRTGIRARCRNAIFQHPIHKFMIANLDGIANDPKEGSCIFEAKTASEYKKEVWENGVANNLKLILGNSEEGYAGSHTVKWGTVRSNRFDSKRFQKDYPDLCKDSVFTTLFNDKEKLIELYNALEGMDRTWKKVLGWRLGTALRKTN